MSIVPLYGNPFTPNNIGFGTAYLQRLRKIRQDAELARKLNAGGAAPPPVTSTDEEGNVTVDEAAPKPAQPAGQETDASKLGAMIQQYGQEATTKLQDYAEYQRTGGWRTRMPRPGTPAWQEAEAKGRVAKFHARQAAEKEVDARLAEGDTGYVMTQLGLPETSTIERTGDPATGKNWWIINGRTIDEPFLREQIRQKVGAAKGSELAKVSNVEYHLRRMVPSLPNLPGKLIPAGPGRFYNVQTGNTTDLGPTLSQTIQNQITTAGQRPKPFHYYAAKEGRWMLATPDGQGGITTREFDRQPVDVNYQTHAFTERQKDGGEIHKLAVWDKAHPQTHETYTVGKSAAKPGAMQTAWGTEKGPDGKPMAVMMSIRDGQIQGMARFAPGFIPKGMESAFNEARDIQIIRETGHRTERDENQRVKATVPVTHVYALNKKTGTSQYLGTLGSPGEGGSLGPAGPAPEPGAAAENAAMPAPPSEPTATAAAAPATTAIQPPTVTPPVAPKEAPAAAAAPAPAPEPNRYSSAERLGYMPNQSDPQALDQVKRARDNALLEIHSGQASGSAETSLPIYDRNVGRAVLANLQQARLSVPDAGRLLGQYFAERTRAGSMPIQAPHEVPTEKLPPAPAVPDATVSADRVTGRIMDLAGNSGSRTELSRLQNLKRGDYVNVLLGNAKGGKQPARVLAVHADRSNRLLVSVFGADGKTQTVTAPAVEPTASPAPKTFNERLPLTGPSTRGAPASPAVIQQFGEALRTIGFDPKANRPLFNAILWHAMTESGWSVKP